MLGYLESKCVCAGQDSKESASGKQNSGRTPHCLTIVPEWGLHPRRGIYNAASVEVGCEGCEGCAGRQLSMESQELSVGQ